MMDHAPKKPDGELGVNRDIPVAAQLDEEFDYTKVYLEAYITEPEPKVWIGWCSECDIPVVEGKMVVATFHYQWDIDRCNHRGWGHPLERIEVAHEKCLSGEITR